MIRLAIILASTTIIASTIPTAASQCAPATAIAATRMHWAVVRSQLNKATEHEVACRTYATLFYESVTTRQAVAGCIHDGDYGSEIAALDSEIDAFNNLLATRCGS
jgi:hypothetical protein